MSAPDPLPRPWWKSRISAVAAAAIVALVGVAGYFGVEALLADRSPQPTPAGSLAEVKGLPPGATACPPVYRDLLTPFNSGARGTPTTSCPFVEQVRREYARQSWPSSGTIPLNVVSPATEKQYQLACVTAGSYVTCAGGAAAVIYLYNKP
jgi:hypothetical protein